MSRSKGKKKFSSSFATSEIRSTNWRGSSDDSLETWTWGSLLMTE